MPNLKILVVEDEPDGAEVVEMMLNSVNIDTTVAGSAEEALQKLEEDADFDALIIDLALPGMDGFELLGVVQKWQDIHHIPKIAITAFHTPELKDKALEAGFDGYFAKPLDTTIFVGTLERLLNGE
jgi:CheY-like chemotaxis protein